MSNDLNKVMLIGRLGKDPEVRYMTNGDPVCNFSLATGKSWTVKDTGEKKTSTEWHRIVVWGKLAEICTEYLKKGSQVYLEGEIQTREWKDKEENKRQTTEIKVSHMQMLGSKSDGGHQEHHEHHEPNSKTADKQASQPKEEPKTTDDGIPF